MKRKVENELESDYAGKYLWGDNLSDEIDHEEVVKEPGGYSDGSQGSIIFEDLSEHTEVLQKINEIDLILIKQIINLAPADQLFYMNLIVER